MAMQSTGTAELLAERLTALVRTWDPRWLLTGFFALTVLLTQPMSNAAAALTILPVAVAAAEPMAVDPRPLAILVTLSASLSFVTPLEPASLLVYGPGKYRFSDFIRTGLPLSVLMVALLVWLRNNFV